MNRTHKLWNIALIFLSMALTVLMCCLTTPTDTTISAMQARQPVLGVAWAVITSLAVFFNMDYLCKKCGIHNLCFRIFLWIGSIAALLTPFTLSDSPIGFTVPFINLHRLCAVIFAVVIYVAMITLLLAKRKTYGKLYTIFVAVLMAVGGLNVYGIFALSSFISALMETCLLLVGFTVLLLASYVVPELPSKEAGDTKRTQKLAVTAICIATLIFLICGITAIPSYRVQISNEVITEAQIPQSGYTEVDSEYFRIALPENWQERKYSDYALYYDDIDRNRICVTYEAKKNFDNMTRFNVIQNFSVTSARLISYMERPMLIVEKQEHGDRIYSYLFNYGDKSVSITLTFTSAEADCHEEILYSLQIKNDGDLYEAQK